MAIYYNLVIRCPICIAKGSSGSSPSQWYHADCGGETQIGDDAHLKCTSCGLSKHLRHWRYTCEEHTVDYCSTTVNQGATAISIAGQIVSIAGKRWLMTLLENMGDGW